MPSYAEDRAAIEDLQARYLFALDWFDADGYAECFTEDGVLDWAFGTTVGREAIREEARTMKGKMAQVFGEGIKLRHFVTQVAITVNGDTAQSRAYWFEAMNNGPDGEPKMGTFGHYEDECVRVDGRWLFARRKIFNEFLAGREGGPVNPAMEEGMRT